uniref:Autophagy-related protein 16 domain-containing protein n=1 Tax=Panagrolaimus sp. PS1159 TaxID=55785 RepID=A0AC35FPZ9_9BILA
MTASTSDFRTVILQNLQRRNRRCAQFERVFQSYTALSDSLNYLVVQNSKLRQQKGGGSGNGESGNVNNEAAEELKKELDRVYRLKAINDQQLIEAKNQLAELEKQLNQISLERDKHFARVLEIEEELKQAKITVDEVKADHQLISDEHMALQAICNKLEQDYLKANNERNELIERLKGYKMQEIEMINQSNEVENERVRKRIQSQMEEAVALLPPIDATGFEMLSSDGLSENVFTENFCDFIPSRCKQKHSCDASEITKFLQSGRQIVSGGSDRTVKTWDIISSRCSRTFFAGSIVLDLAVNDRTGAPIISTHYDRKVRFWDMRDASPSKVLETSAKVTSLCITPDGYGALLMSRDETLSMVDLRNHSVLHIYSAEQFRVSIDTARCSISPSGAYVSAGSADGQIFVWDTNTTKLEKILYKDGHDGNAVISTCWHPQGRMILSGDRKKTFCIWA